jgi:glutamyl-tRNA synthetase
MAEDINALIEKYALANAFSHNGKAQPGVIIGKLIADDPKYREQMKDLAPKIAKLVSEVNKMKIDEQEKKLLKVFPEFFEKKETKHEEKTLKELPNAQQGKVVLRLAPFPSGPLHIGNAKTYLLNALYAEKYAGKLLLIIDDTISSKEKPILKEAYDLIPEGFEWLGVKWDGPIVYKSDRLETYYKYAEELIKKNSAYVCECPTETLRKNRAEGKECFHRKQSVKENLEKWEAMHKGKYKEGQASLRLKTSMTNPNPAFRDRVLFRISDRAHPRVDKKYRVWPMLEFSWAIDDHLLGVTHVIRGKDLVMETEMCKFIWDILKWPHPTIIHTGLARMEGIKLSKSKAQKEVLSGSYTGWDDPRTWSLQSLKRRGILPHAIRHFISSIGLNENDITIPVENLYAINRKLLDPVAHRYSFVADPVELNIKDAPNIKEIEVKLHPDSDKEFKKIKINNSFYIWGKDFNRFKGQEVRLMHLYNINLNPKSEFTSQANKQIPRIQWVPTDFAVKAEVLMPDGEMEKGFAEKNAENLKVGDIIQFERFGFVRLEKKDKDKLKFVYTHG